MRGVGVPVLESRIATDLPSAREAADTLGYPIILRPAFTLGGEGGGVADAKTVTIAIHVRRGDVTYLDKYSRPSSRWVETTAMLEVLRGVSSVLGVPLARPAVRRHLVTCASHARAHHDANSLSTGTGTPLLRSERLAGERHGRAACGRAARGVTSGLEPVCDHRRPYPHEPCGCAADGCLGLLKLGGRLMATDGH